MPAMHQNLSATYLVASLAVVFIVISAMWSSFVDYPAGIEVRTGWPVKRCVLSPATVSLVTWPTSSDIYLCITAVEDDSTIALAAAATTFTFAPEMGEAYLGLCNAAGEVCLSFDSPAHLKRFAAFLEDAGIAAVAEEAAVLDQLDTLVLSGLNKTVNAAMDNSTLPATRDRLGMADGEFAVAHV